MSTGPSTAQAQQPLGHGLQSHQASPSSYNTNDDIKTSPKAVRAHFYPSYPQVAESDYPEVVNADYPEAFAPSTVYPEVVDSSYPEAVPASAEKQVQSPGGFSSQYDGLLAAQAGPPQPEPRPWWRRKRAWLVAVGVGLVVIGIVLGCVLGLVVFRRPGSADAPAAPASSSAPASPSTPAATMPSGTSSCTSTVCAAQAVTAVAGGDGNAHVFARAPDGSWKQASSGSGDGGDSYGNWTSRGGSFDGAPAVLAWTSSASSTWGGGATVSLFGVSPSSKRIMVKHVGLGSRNGAAAASTIFTDIGMPDSATTEPPTLCSPNNNRADVWMRAPNVTLNKTAPGLIHKRVDKEADWEVVTYEWSGAGDMVPASRFGIVCRDSDAFHDTVVYGNGTAGSSAWHRQFVASNWGNWTDLGGDYAPGTDPVLLETSSQRFDFFGLGRDSRLHHWSWSAGSGYSKSESLGSDTFASVPAVSLSGAKKDRIEVVAVGKDDGRLKHFGFGIDAPASAAKWDDLGAVANSAPSLVRTAAGAVHAVTTAVDGSVWYATSSNGWDKIAWKPIPGL
ncbi:hypothetical protein RB595_000189 [Gaeumannomyces hyphopodioides]